MTSVDDKADLGIPTCDGLTLIMACRSEKRAEAARKMLYTFLDAHVAKLQAQKGYDGHADVFRKNVKIEIHQLDLASLDTVFRCANEILERSEELRVWQLNVG